MGMFLAKDRPSQPGFARLIELLKRKIGFVKLTGVYRMSQMPGFADAAPMARALIEAAPDRLIWGSDYPHLSFADKVTSEGLFALFKQWAATRWKNPRRQSGEVVQLLAFLPRPRGIGDPFAPRAGIKFPARQPGDLHRQQVVARATPEPQ
jgi:hypothetical protein